MPAIAKKLTNKNRIRLYIIIALVLAILAGYCLVVFTDMPEVNERTLVTKIGIDIEEDDVVVTAHILVATAGLMESEFRQDTSVVRGSSLFEALNRFYVAKGRKVEFGSCGLVVLGNEIAEQGILQPIKELMATNLVSPGTLLVAAETTAHEFLETSVLLGERTSENIAKFLTRFQETLAMPSLMMLTYLNGELGESGASFIPIVELRAQEDTQEERGGDNNDEEEEEGGEAEEADICCIQKAAIFKGGVRVGTLNWEESMGLVLLKPESRRGVFESDSFSFNQQDFDPVFGSVRRKTVRTKTAFINGMPHMTITVDMDIEVITRHEIMFLTDTFQTSHTALFDTIATAFSQKATEQIAAALAASRQLDADFLQLKYEFYRTQHANIIAYDLQETSNFLHDLTVEVVVNTRAK